jgi:hypothetical protein
MLSWIFEGDGKKGLSAKDRCVGRGRYLYVRSLCSMTNLFTDSWMR